MKTSISTLAAAALVAAFATTTAHAATRIVNHGRSGYCVAPYNENARPQRNATIVALAMEKPEQGPTRIQTAGRAGYVAVPNLNR